MLIIAMNMFDIAAKLVVVGLVCAFVCYWLLAAKEKQPHAPLVA
jgi:hypothetical protein